LYHCYTIVLLQEVEKYNRLIQVIETSLGMLLRAISGQEVMSPALD